MLSGDENIVDVDFVVFWRISDAPKFLFNIQDPEMTVKDVAESAMREIVGQSDIEPLLTEARAKTEAAVQALMQKTLDSYGAGVQVTQVQLQKVDPPGTSDRRLPRRAGGSRRPGAAAERGASLCQPHHPGSQGRGRAHPAGGARLSRQGGGRIQG